MYTIFWTNVFKQFLRTKLPVEFLFWCCEFTKVILKSRGWCEMCVKKLSGIHTKNGVFPQLCMVRNHHFFPRAVKISFLHTKGCGNAIPIILMIKISIYTRRDLHLFHANTCILFVMQKIFNKINKKFNFGGN